MTGCIFEDTILFDIKYLKIYRISSRIYFGKQNEYDDIYVVMFYEQWRAYDYIIHINILYRSYFEIYYLHILSSIIQLNVMKLHYKILSTCFIIYYQRFIGDKYRYKNILYTSIPSAEFSYLNELAIRWMVCIISKMVPVVVISKLRVRNNFIGYKL